MFCPHGCPQAAGVTMPGGACAMLTAMLYPSGPDDDSDSEGGVGAKRSPEGGSMLSVAGCPLFGAGATHGASLGSRPIHLETRGRRPS